MKAINNIQELNEVTKKAKNAYKEGVKSPIRLMNIMNGQAFKNDPDLRAALKLYGATKWSLDLAPRTLTGAICKIGKAVSEDYIFEEDATYTFVAGKLYYATVINTFRGEEFLTICKTKKAIELKAANKIAKELQKEENKKAKAAQNAAKKAQKAADKKRRDAIDLNKLSEFEAWLASQANDAKNAVNE